MPSITDFPSLLTWVRSWKPGASCWKIYKEQKSGPYSQIRTDTVEILSFLTPAVGLYRDLKNAHNLLEIMAPVKGKKLVVHEKIEFSSPP
jgi:hypothetical protein